MNINWSNIIFSQPLWFLALLAIPLIVYIDYRKILQSKLNWVLPTAHKAPLPKTGYKKYLLWINTFFKCLGIVGLVLAMARPQSSSTRQNVDSEGINIIMAMDVSGSMLARDLKPNRLEASKAVGIEFIQHRFADRIGLVLYAGESFTQCPLTTDHVVLENMLQKVENGMIEDGTAIGNGLATSIDRLRTAEGPSNVVILLTDGSNNSGEVPPLTAAEIAKTYGIRVYTIGVGTNGYADYPVTNMFGQTSYQKVKVEIDEKTLQSIAEITGGKYFRATDNASLEEIYQEIDQLEKAKIEVTEFRKKKEEFKPFLLWGLILIGTSILLQYTLLTSLTL